LEILFTIFTITDKFSNDLQSSDIDIEFARNKAEIVKNSIADLRCETSFEDIWSSAVSLAATIDVIQPGTVGRTVRRPSRYEDGSAPSHQFTSIKDEYKATVYYPVIDRISNELQERFCNSNRVILGQLYKVLIGFDKTEGFPDETTASVATFYNLNHSDLKLELHVMRNSDARTKNLKSIVELGHFLIDMKLVTWFPLLTYLMRVYLSLPVTSCASERTFSQLKLLKDETRSTMSQSRLHGLALMKIEKRYLDSLKLSDIIAVFANKKSRRQKFF